MATCSVCWGSGGTHGGYKPCYRCSGSGHGGFTNVACMACGGSGQSSERELNICTGCGGSGKVADPVSAGAPARRISSPAGKGRPGRARPWTRNEVIALAPAYAASVWGLFEYAGLDGWVPFAVGVLPAVVVARLWKALVILAIAVGGIWLFSATSR